MPFAYCGLDHCHAAVGAEGGEEVVAHLAEFVEGFFVCGDEDEGDFVVVVEVAGRGGRGVGLWWAVLVLLVFPGVV